MARRRQIVGNWPMALSPAIAKTGNRKTPEHHLRGFSSSNMDYSLHFAYRHYSICKNALQYAFDDFSWTFFHGRFFMEIIYPATTKTPDPCQVKKFHISPGTMKPDTFYAPL